MMTKQMVRIITSTIQNVYSDFWDMNGKCDLEELSKYLINRFKISKADRDEMWDLIHDHAEDDVYDSMGDMED